MIFAVAVLALAAATATGAAAAPKLVNKVDKVEVKIVRGHMIVTASGAVNSGGWTRPHLHLREIRIPESDHETIDFLATPPPSHAAVIQALLPVKATARFPLARYGTVRITVVGESNSVTVPY